MTRRLLSVHFKKIVAALLASSASAWTFALSFDAVTVFSHLGEPLHAEIPVILNDGETLDSGLAFKAASAEVYADAHVPFNDQVLTIHYHLEKKTDRQFSLVATSDQPIDTPMLVALVEFTSQGSRVFKELVFSLESHRSTTSLDHRKLHVDFLFDGALNIAPSAYESGGATVDQQNMTQQVSAPVVPTVIPEDVARNPRFLQQYMETSNLNVAVAAPSEPAQTLPPSPASPGTLGSTDSPINLGVSSQGTEEGRAMSDRDFDQMSSPQYAAMPVQAPPAALDQLHRVRDGETLASVAQMFLYPHVDLSTMERSIAERNVLSMQAPLSPGMVLVIPSFMSVQAMMQAKAKPANMTHGTKTKLAAKKRVMVKPRVTTHGGVRHTTHHAHHAPHLGSLPSPAHEKRPHHNTVKVSKALLGTQEQEEDALARRRSLASVDEMQKKIDAEIKQIEQQKKNTASANTPVTTPPVAPSANTTAAARPMVTVPPVAVSEDKEFSPFERLVREYADILPYAGVAVIIVFVLLGLVAMRRKKGPASGGGSSSDSGSWLSRLFRKKKTTDLSSVDHELVPVASQQGFTAQRAHQASEQSIVFHAENTVQDKKEAVLTDVVAPALPEGGQSSVTKSSEVKKTQTAENTSQHQAFSNQPAEAILTDSVKISDKAKPSEDLDPISEAGVYMAYGRLGQAEELLSDALRKNPNNQDIRLKLIDIFSQQKNVVAFSQEAAIYYDFCKGEGEGWASVAEMGRSIDPDNALYTFPQQKNAAEDDLEPLDLSIDLEELPSDASQADKRQESDPAHSGSSPSHLEGDGSEFIVSMDDKEEKKS